MSFPTRAFVIGHGVIPDARIARDRESRNADHSRILLWIPDQAFGLSGMTLESAIQARALMLRRRRRRRLEACGPPFVSSEQDLKRYLVEFEFRNNNRAALGVNDGTDGSMKVSKASA